jgi:short-subunit dehydrogenase
MGSNQKNAEHSGSGSRARAARWARLLRRALGPTPHAPRPHSLREALLGKRVVVTGASSGIGRAVALEVTAHGATALLVARKRAALEQVCAEIRAAGGKAEVFVADLSQAEDCERLLDALHAAGPVDILINNAGRSIRRSVRHAYARVHDFERTMALNYFGALRLILGILPEMRARRAGHIINVSSAGVLFKTPRFAAYVASKAALDAFSEVAATEAYADHVHFTTVHMPLVRTPMIAPTRVYRRVPALSPEQAAQRTLSALVSQKTRITPFLAGWSAVSRALFPESTLRVINAIYRSTTGSNGGSEVARAGHVDAQGPVAGPNGQVSKAS